MIYLHWTLDTGHVAVWRSHSVDNFLCDYGIGREGGGEIMQHAVALLHMVHWILTTGVHDVVVIHAWMFDANDKWCCCWGLRFFLPDMMT